MQIGMRSPGIVVLLLVLGLPAFAADSFPINVYPCPRTASTPRLDGKLDDAVWQQAPVVSGFVLFETDKLANPQTSFRLLWDDRYLYLGVRCDEPQMSKARGVRLAHDEHAVFGNEAVEFFVDPDHTHARYYQIAFDMAGSLYDGEGESTTWNSDAQVVPCLGADFWSVEIAVPWGPLKTRPLPGKVVGFNVNRDRCLDEKTWTTWAQVMNGFHDPERFAHLVLSGTPETIGKLSSEFRKGGRTGPITVYSAEGFAQTSYAALSVAAFTAIEKLLADLDAERRLEKEPGAAAEIKRRLDAYGTQVAGLKQQSAGTLDAAAWTRLNIELQSIAGQLSKTVWVARLTALLDSI